MKRRPVDQLVYECMIPRPKQSDPPNFHGILTRYLVFEVRQEVHSFYGHISTQEARYPGLDYCHRVHRIRLSRWPWHRRLFRAFDTLRLTPAEIAALTKWEGTKWAKERYEKEQGITIRDTSADGLPDWREPGSRWRDQAEDKPMTTALSITEQPVAENKNDSTGANPEARSHGHGHDDEDSDLEIQSIGLQLNERLLERVAAHNAGDTSLPLDEDWEQWLKNAIEEGNLTLVTDHIMRLADSHIQANSPNSPNGSNSPNNGNDVNQARLMNAARQGHWDEVPGLLRDVVRTSFWPGRIGGSASPSSLSQGSNSPLVTMITAAVRQQEADPSARRTYSSLRLPSSDH